MIIMLGFQEDTRKIPQTMLFTAAAIVKECLHEGERGFRVLKNKLEVGLHLTPGATYPWAELNDVLMAEATPVEDMQDSTVRTAL